MKALVNVDDLEPGQIVAETIYDTMGDRLLLSEGIALDERMIWRLKQRRICAINVVDHLAETRSPEDALGTNRIETVQSLSAFVNNFHASGTASLEPLNKAVDGIINTLTADKTVMVYLQQISVHDHDVLAHSVDVAIYSTLIGLSCGLHRRDITTLGTGALLHDLGKLGVDKHLLAKPSALTNHEYQTVKRHPEYGYQQLAHIPSLDENARRVSLEHHERLDGSGYPYGLRDSDIQLFSRIAAVCDVYDALVMERSYKKAYRPDQAARMLRTSTNLDKNLIEALLTRLVMYPVGTKVRLNNGAVGEVVKEQSETTRNPMVVLLLTKHNENMLRTRRLEVIEVGKGLRIEDVVEEPEYQNMLSAGA